MSRSIILLDADDAETVCIIKADYPDDFEDNMVFDTPDAADQWLMKNARNGWCTRIVELEE